MIEVRKKYPRNFQLDVMRVFYHKNEGALSENINCTSGYWDIYEKLKK